ncbi:MAG: hypothetical protein HZA23_06755 [Nitrospirae bacterium]|nr:hypothetical protein [Nitrospirota bacterium]
MSNESPIPSLAPRGVGLAPPFALVARHLYTAVGVFVLLSLLLFWQADLLHTHYFQGRLLALTHLATLGWMTLVMMGTLYQLVPVLLEAPLRSPRLASWTFWIFAAGAAGLIRHFWASAFNLGLVLTALVVDLALLLFCFHMLTTLRRVSSWSLTRLHVTAAVLYLAGAAALGGGLAFNLWRPAPGLNHLEYLVYHAHFAMGGWITLVVMGVSYQLIPMFALAHGYSEGPARIALVLVNAGLLALAGSMAGLSALFIPTVLLLAGGVIAFLCQISLILKKRTRKDLDLGLRHAVVAFVILGIVALLGMALGLGGIPEAGKVRWSIAYGFLAVFGYVSILVMGMLYKVLPFLVWHHRYSDRVGKEPVPLLKEMYSERIGRRQLGLTVLGVVGATGGILLDQLSLTRAALGALALGAVLFGWNMVTVVRSQKSGVRSENA